MASVDACSSTPSYYRSIGVDTNIQAHQTSRTKWFVIGSFAAVGVAAILFTGPSSNAFLPISSHQALSTSRPLATRSLAVRQLTRQYSHRATIVHARDTQIEDKPEGFVAQTVVISVPQAGLWAALSAVAVTFAYAVQQRFAKQRPMPGPLLACAAATTLHGGWAGSAQALALDPSAMKPMDAIPPLEKKNLAPQLTDGNNMNSVDAPSLTNSNVIPDSSAQDSATQVAAQKTNAASESAKQVNIQAGGGEEEFDIGEVKDVTEVSEMVEEVEELIEESGLADIAETLLEGLEDIEDIDPTVIALSVAPLIAYSVGLGVQELKEEIAELSEDANLELEDFSDFDQHVNIEVLESGNGTCYPKIGDAIEVHYIGSLGQFGATEFESSYSLSPGPANMVLGGRKLPRGCEAALMKMSEGERCLVRVQPEWGFGKEGRKGIVPPDSTLLYFIELVSVSSDRNTPNGSGQPSTSPSLLPPPLVPIGSGAPQSK